MFTLGSYKEFLQQALSEQFHFMEFTFDALQKKENKKCIWLRHDIDNDLGAALEMAEIEAHLGVVATYFVMLRSPLYNLFSRANYDIVNKILSFGHHVALHYDANFNFEKDNLLQNINQEVMALNNLFKLDITAVSFYQPGEIILQKWVLKHCH